MRRKYVVIFLVLVFLSWLGYSFTQEEKTRTGAIDKFVKEVRRITNRSEKIMKSQRKLIEGLQKNEIKKKGASRRVDELLEKNNRILKDLQELSPPNKIRGPVSILQSSLRDRLRSAQIIRKALENDKMSSSNLEEAKTLLTKSTSGIHSAFRRIEVVQSL